MAKNDSLAVFKARGSAGPITYANWKGIGYFKQKAFIVANPKTDGQINARARLALMVVAFQLIGSAVNAGFKEMAVKMSAYNAFVKANINSALLYVSLGVYEIVPENLQVSKGTLGNTSIATSSATAAGNTLTVTYDNTVQSYNQSLDDEVQILYTNRDTGVTGWSLASGQTRADGTVTVTVEGGVSLGEEIECYMWFKAATGTKVSDSQYVLITAGA